MSGGWVIAGTILQFFLAIILLNFVVFSIGIFESTPLNNAVFQLSLLAVPATCLLSAGIVIYSYYHSGNANTYWWYVLPLFAAVAYFIYVAKNQSGSSGLH